MNETTRKIDLFVKRQELGAKISRIIEERGLSTDEEISSLQEHVEFEKLTKELTSLYS